MDIGLGELRFIRELASGRTSSVHLCEQESKGAYYAVKKIPKATIAAPQRIFAEKKALLAIQHPNIMVFYNTLKDDEHIYFVNELIRGGPLYLHIRAGVDGCLDCTAAQFYTAQTVLALKAMHRANFCHRDLKANNVMLTADGNIKLIDLGYVKELDGYSGKSQSFVGTPHAMAPEMVSKTGHGMQVDWWALGILLHEMLTGLPPFGLGEHREALFERITAGVNEDIFAKEVFDVDETSRLAPALITALLHADPAKRLGASGAADVMANIFFASLDWEQLELGQLVPPVFNESLLESFDEAEALAADEQKLFDDF
jgi:serine/threonine protein kinase